MSATDDVARMLTLVPWLLERPGASVAEAAETFGVSERRIRRDLEEHLDFCGLPGLGGGDLFDVSIEADRIVVQMADELRRPLRPTPAEALRLVLSVDAVAEVLHDELPALASGIAKVRAALGVSEQVADVLEPAGTAAVVVARQALTEGRRLRLRYQGRGDEAPRDREVDPWAVRVVRSVWYLQGHDHGADAARTFRLDRVADIAIEDASVAVPAPDELPPPRYQAGPDDVRVVLDLAPGGRWVADAVDRVELVEGDAGRARLTFTTDAPRHVVDLVLMAGGDAVVVEPASLATLVAERAVAARDRHR